MVFSSVIFLFLFLPTTLALYFMFPRATRNAFASDPELRLLFLGASSG